WPHLVVWAGRTAKAPNPHSRKKKSGRREEGGVRGPVISLGQAQRNFIAEAALNLGAELAECRVILGADTRFFKLYMALHPDFSAGLLVMQPYQAESAADVLVTRQ